MVPTRIRTPSAGMERALLDAAAELLEEEGPEALSVRRIATAAGVAPMGVYNHFASKAGIVEALFIEGFERLAQAMVTLDAVDDPLEALLEGGRRYRSLALAHPKVYELMFLRPVPGFEPSDEALEIAAQAFDGLATVVRRAMAAGVLSAGEVALTSQVIWAGIHGWVSLELAGIGFADDQAAGAARMYEVLVFGLAPRS